MDWHRRFLQQAGWTTQLRAHLFGRAGVHSARRVLDLGCGTGALLAENRAGAPAWYGLDLDWDHLQQAAGHAPGAILLQGDAHQLPLATASLDVVFCHYVLLWLDDPLAALKETVRVLRPGGTVIALAEPDYGGRIDYPQELEILGQAQTASLRMQGADPLTGRKLSGLFHSAGLVSVETGVIGGQWSQPPTRDAWDDEWAVILNDLEQNNHARDVFSRALMELDWAAWQQGERILYVPTFFATGIKP